MRRRIHVTYEEEDTCHVVKDKKRLLGKDGHKQTEYSTLSSRY
jgi:hypothetical protein